jgi:hypothetical protein
VSSAAASSYFTHSILAFAQPQAFKLLNLVSKTLRVSHGPLVTPWEAESHLHAGSQAADVRSSKDLESSSSCERQSDKTAGLCDLYYLAIFRRILTLGLSLNLQARSLRPTVYGFKAKGFDRRDSLPHSRTRSEDYRDREAEAKVLFVNGSNNDCLGRFSFRR